MASVEVLEMELRGLKELTANQIDHIGRDTSEIKNMIRDQTNKMDDGIKRIHLVLDERIAGVMTDIANVETIARAEAKLALDFSKDVGERVSKIETEFRTKTAYVLGAAAAISLIAGFIIDRIG